MSRRFTRTEKWDDPWFFELSPTAKLLFIYVCDKCDNAGFWDINVRLAALTIGVTEENAQTAFEQLSRTYVINGDILYLRNFLKHQRNLPFKDCKAHIAIQRIFPERGQFGKSIYEKLQSDSDSFSSIISETNNQSDYSGTIDGPRTNLSRNSIVKDKYSKGIVEEEKEEEYVPKPLPLPIDPNETMADRLKRGTFYPEDYGQCRVKPVMLKKIPPFDTWATFSGESVIVLRMWRQVVKKFDPKYKPETFFLNCRNLFFNGYGPHYLVKGFRQAIKNGDTDKTIWELFEPELREADDTHISGKEWHF